MGEVKVYKLNQYNPTKGQPFYLDNQGNPTKERLGELLFSGDFFGAKEVTDAMENVGDFDYEIIFH